MTESREQQSKVVATRDGSHTIYSSQFDQHYHNPNGAVAESKHVFFEQSPLLDDISNSNPITILEVGFGTGLNLLLLMDYCQKLNPEAQINYYSIEGFPISEETARNLNYEQHLRHPSVADHLPTIFDDLSEGMNEFSITSNISLYLFNGMFGNFNPNNLQADYIFHDAFSPDVNSKLWTGDTFKTLASFSNDDVILTTYCAASKAQGAMAWAGWKVAKTQGALGKREMIVASLSEEPLSHLKRINEEHYAQRYQEGDFN
ncbi:tRNA (5-methylaminomethyl-2-thiouridine)(34)-methyltransferase MnmD [Fodinibius sp.]|uniref:tRNA (5-methylaminomethyl-2-thiouridine)(34)-methyltransferase MnmD n=1 Tax=Fodinibius sp. TaxID=1872440 RepID=UPI002ACDED9D|nr:tRNA (5-methylaminomethyl-2-thiouridine)(34)-methyltransferase MnmD [Fodinibius sp.]MDZ7659591.1 tRNA (5-methylaminomethyl-2-thiouridine)(34)-methyltransferase MnmD [Fodinibius sp.]